jgi:hypothetical protein
MSEAYTVISVTTEITVILAKCQDSSFCTRTLSYLQIQKVFEDRYFPGAHVSVAAILAGTVAAPILRDEPGYEESSKTRLSKTKAAAF